MDLPNYMSRIGKQAREAAKILGCTPTINKNNALEAIAQQIEQQHDSLIKANAKDIEAGKGLDAALLDRLALNDSRLTSMIEGLRQMMTLPDPIGEMTDSPPMRRAYVLNLEMPPFCGVALRQFILTKRLPDAFRQD